MTRQSYDSNTDSHGADPTWEEVQSVLAPADSEVYYFNNLVHHCHGNGLGTKNSGSDGPFYFLSNVIHISGNGIKASLNHSVVRNNIIYAGEWMDNAMLWGWSPSTDIYAQIANAVGITVENNTFVGAPVGIAHRGGWNGLLRNNLFIDTTEPHRLISTWYSWHNGWPWVVGEYVYGDLTAEHPYFPEMPTALQSRVGHYFRLQAQGNVYSAEPLITADVVGGHYDLRGSTLSNDHTVLPVETIESHLQDPAGSDYRRSPTDPGPIAGVGSAIQ